jgi:hypothetical protein
MMMMEYANLQQRHLHRVRGLRGRFQSSCPSHHIQAHAPTLYAPTLVDKCDKLYGVCTTDYITPCGSTTYININRGNLHGDTLSPFLFTLFLEPFMQWLTVGSRGYRPSAPTTNDDPTKPTANYHGHGFTDDLSLPTGSPTNMTTQLKMLSLFSAYTFI